MVLLLLCVQVLASHMVSTATGLTVQYHSSEGMKVLASYLSYHPEELGHILLQSPKNRSLGFPLDLCCHGYGWDHRFFCGTWLE